MGSEVAQAKSVRMRDVVVLVVLQVALGTVCLNCVPRIWTDEVWDSSLGYNLAHEGVLRHPFIEGFGGMHIHFVQNRVLLPLVCAAFFSFADYSIFLSRFASVLFGTLAIVSLYGVMCRWFGPRQALWMGLATIMHPRFLEISRCARPEIYYAALGLVLLWLMVVYFDNGSRRTAFFAGVVIGLCALTHPTGLILAFSIGVGVVLWRGDMSVWRLLGWASMGAALVILPYIIYVCWAIQDPRVSFAAQMQLGRVQRLLLKGEIFRWKAFWQWPIGAPLAFILLVSWIAAWLRSSDSDKALATIVALFVLILPFASVSGTARYLAAATPFFSALLVRLIWRMRAGEIGICPNRYRLRSVIASGALVVYFLAAMAAIGAVFYRLRGADLDKVIDNVASAVGPESRVYAPPIYWLGDGRYRYGPFPFHPQPTLVAESVEMVRKHDFDYAVRTCFPHTPMGIRQPPRSLPDFRNYCVGDYVCQSFGTKVDEFYDPYYGPIEVYRLDWSRPPKL